MSDKITAADVPSDVRDEIIAEALAQQQEAAKPQIDPETVECATCGKNGFPSKGCNICHGTANIQSRAYTLSEERSGRAPNDGERYDRLGKCGPKIVQVPG